MKYEVSTCSKTPALTETPHQNLCALPGFVCAQSSCGCNKQGETRENSGENRRGNWSWLCWWQLFINSFLVVSQPSASKLCMLFSAEVDVSHCSWKLKEHSCSNEIKNTDITVPDFHQGIRLHSSLQIWVQNNFLEASRVAPTLRLSQTYYFSTFMAVFS